MPTVIAESMFKKFIDECLCEFAEELLPGTGQADLANETLRYMARHAGKRLQVRMQNGRIQVHRAFDIVNPLIRHPSIELPQPGDELLPLYTLMEFRLLDGLCRDVREKADELQLPWNLAFSILKQHVGRASIKPAAVEVAGKISSLDTRSLLTMSQVMTLFSVSRSTVYRWADDGKLQRAALGKKAGAKGKFLVTAASVAKFKEESSE